MQHDLLYECYRKIRTQYYIFWSQIPFFHLFAVFSNIKHSWYNQTTQLIESFRGKVFEWFCLPGPWFEEKPVIDLELDNQTISTKHKLVRSNMFILT